MYLFFKYYNDVPSAATSSSPKWNKVISTEKKYKLTSKRKRKEPFERKMLQKRVSRLMKTNENWSKIYRLNHVEYIAMILQHGHLFQSFVP